MKSIIGATILSIILSTNAYSQIKAYAQASAICTPEQHTLYRTEAWLSNIPFNTDAYLRHEFGRQEFNKQRLQSLPISYGLLNSGLALQHVDTKTNVTELGIVGRIKTKTENINIKLDMQEYPASKKLDWYGFFNLKSFGIDFLGTLDYGKETLFLLPRAYFIRDNLMIGIESRFDKPRDSILKNTYTGLLLGVTI